jgi:hypothetical protein
MQLSTKPAAVKTRNTVSSFKHRNPNANIRKHSSVSRASSSEDPKFESFESNIVPLSSFFSKKTSKGDPKNKGDVESVPDYDINNAGAFVEEPFKSPTIPKNTEESGPDFDFTVDIDTDGSAFVEEAIKTPEDPFVEAVEKENMKAFDEMINSSQYLKSANEDELGWAFKVAFNDEKMAMFEKMMQSSAFLEKTNGFFFAWTLREAVEMDKVDFVKKMLSSNIFRKKAKYVLEGEKLFGFEKDEQKALLRMVGDGKSDLDSFLDVDFE